MRQRIKRIFKNTKSELDAIVLKNSSDPHIDLNFFYVTGLTSGIFEESIVVLHADLSLDLITTELEAETARRGRGDLKVSVFKSKKEQIEVLKEKLQRAKRIGVNKYDLVCSDFDALRSGIPEAQLTDVSGALLKTRLVKDPDEISLISRAAKIASKALEDPVTLIRDGRREYEVAAELNYVIQKGGATAPAFDTIVAFGANSAEPHHSSGAKRARRGELELIDMGANCERYCSDITRTYVRGKASRVQAEMYETVLRARDEALKAVRDGANAKDVHMAAQAVIDDTKFKGKFTHGLGHSIGLSVHDGGRISSAIDTVLLSGMVFTIEPGIYIPGYGGMRVEDDILVTKRGHRLLTDAPRPLEI